MTESPLDVAIFSPGMPHGPGVLKERSLGGSETAAICVSEALARRGCHVVLFSPGHNGGTHHGVTYVPIEHAAAYLSTTQVDLCVISRDLAAASMPMQSVVKFLWAHDLSLKRFRGQFTSSLWTLDAVLVLSAFQRDQYAGLHDIARPVLVQSRNGIDLTRFPSPPVPLERRDRWKLVYGSRPERGLEALLNVMRLAASRNLRWKLVVSTYDNPVEQMRPYYESLEAQAKAIGNIVWLPPQKQSDWTRNLSTARAMVYPGTNTDFREISFLCGMETQACGTPYVACAKGALPETLRPGAGFLLGDEATDVMSSAYAEMFLECIEALNDDAVWREMSAVGVAHAATLSWDGVAEQWIALARELIARRVDNADRVAKHLRRSGDVEALQGGIA